MSSVVLISVCLLASAFFATSETALLRLRPSEAQMEARGLAGLAITELLQSSSRLLVTILLANNVVNVLASAVAAALAVAYLGPELGIGAATVAMTALLLIFCEILPKAAAAAHPRQVARFVALPLYLVHQLLRPVHWAFAAVVDPLVRRLGGRRDGQAASTEEIVAWARASQVPLGAAGGAESIIAAAASASDRTAQEIMVERPHIVAFPLDMPAAEMLEQMLEERFTRVPLYGDSIDHVLGVVHLKDLVRLVRAGGEKAHEILRPVLRVPERKPILELLAEMQQGFVQMAVVKDEHGVTQGLLTGEDILEELVGEIRDEYDREELRSIQAAGDDFEALGWVRVVDFNRESGWSIPAERGDTLGGLVFNQLGRVPRAGDAVDIDDYELRVVDMSGTRIARVLAQRRAPRAEPAEGTDGDAER